MERAGGHLRTQLLGDAGCLRPHPGPSAVPLAGDPPRQWRRVLQPFPDGLLAGNSPPRPPLPPPPRLLNQFLARVCFFHTFFSPVTPLQPKQFHLGRSPSRTYDLAQAPFDR